MGAWLKVKQTPGSEETQGTEVFQLLAEHWLNVNSYREICNKIFK